MGPVERAATTSVARLVLTGESILSQERLAWILATAAKPDGGDGATPRKEDERRTERGTAEGARPRRRDEDGRGTHRQRRGAAERRRGAERRQERRRRRRAP